MPPKATFDDILKERPDLREWLARRPPVTRRPKPKPNLSATAELGPIAREAAKVDPASVELRSLTREADGTVLVERARVKELIEVVEVRDGRPSLIRRIDCETGEASIIEMVGGYRPASMVEKDYDPIKRFEEGFGE